MDFPGDDSPTPDRPACADRAVRRRLVRETKKVFGVDFVEPFWSEGAWKLRVGLLDEDIPPTLTEGNFRIDGERTPGVGRVYVTKVLEVCRPTHDPTVPAEVVLALNPDADIAPNVPRVLRLVEADARNRPTAVRKRDADGELDRATFRFPFPPHTKCDEAVEHDCAPPPVPTDAPPAPPGGAAAIDYLARDYAPARAQMLRRLQITAPDWTERHASDLMVTLLEVVAYAADRLAYAQDAVGTEAYLSTARRRTSVRRHAQLIDYRVSEGCAARAWVCLDLNGTDPLAIGPTDLTFRTAGAGERPRGAADDGSLEFVPVAPTWGPADGETAFHPDWNTLHFYSWGDTVCRLPKGATAATLWAGPGQFPTGTYPAPRVALQPGNVIAIVEIRGPRTGNAADADPRHRHVVRLTSVREEVDPLKGQKVWRVAWDVADALPFPVTISALLPSPAHGQRCEVLPDVTVVKGNVLLVEHGGWRVAKNPFPPVPAAPTPAARCVTAGAPSWSATVPPPFRPVLADGPLTHAEPFPRPDHVALRQARAIRAFRRWLGGTVARAARHIRGGAHLEPAAGVGSGRAGLSGHAALADARLVLGQPAAALEQLEAIARLAAAPDGRHADVFRWLDGLARRLDRGHPLTPEDQAQLDAEFDLTEAERVGRGLVWNSARWLGPATEATDPRPDRATAAVGLTETAGEAEWRPRPDLLGSRGGDRHFVVEVEDDGATLRFPEPAAGPLPDPDALGRPPTPGTTFTAVYRTGQGAIGNVPREALTGVHGESSVVTRIDGFFQPLPAAGGKDPEPLDHVRRAAPGAIARQTERAITAADYADLAGRVPGVARAAGTIGSDGVGTQVVVAIDPAGAADPPADLLAQVGGVLDAYRAIGHAVAVVPAAFVPLTLTITFRPACGVHHGRVHQALGEAFSARRGGYFDPDRWTFGQSVEASAIVAVARAVAGVADAQVTRLARHDPGGGPPPEPPSPHGVLKIGPLEVARLEGDPARPGRGVLRLILKTDPAGGPNP